MDGDGVVIVGDLNLSTCATRRAVEWEEAVAVSDELLEVRVQFRACRVAVAVVHVHGDN